MKKRILSLFLCLVLALSLVPSMAFAAEESASGKCGENLTWTLDDEGTLTISGTGAMDDMPEFLEDRPWQDDSVKTKQIIIEDGVTSIGKHAFQAFFNLASVTIPDSVTSIGDWAFSDCETLTNVTIPDSVTSIGESAFSDCSDIKTVSIGNGVTSIGLNAFRRCSSLESVTIPASMTSFGNYVFYDCSSLESVIFAGNAPALGYLMFADVTATVSYPQCSGTWTDELGQDYGGTLTWVAREHNEIIDTPAVPATCVTDGHEAASHCSVCGAIMSNGASIPATGEHTEVVDVEAKEATCGADGREAVSHCSVCGAIMSKGAVIPATGNHTEVVDVEAKAATCGVDGREAVSHCDVCEKALSKGKPIPATGNHTTKATTTKATLKANGKIVYKCPTCGKTMQSTKTIYMPKTFSLSYTKYTYNGKVKTPTVTVKDSKGNVLKKGTDYKVTYATGRKAVGTYKVTIEGIGKYSFKKTLSFKINPAATKIISATNVATKSIKVKWNKAAGAGGYQVKYIKGTTAKTVTVKGASSLTKTLSKLAKGATYKVYVRSYKTVNSTNYYSAWSAYKSVKVAK